MRPITVRVCDACADSHIWRSKPFVSQPLDITWRELQAAIYSAETFRLGASSVSAGRDGPAAKLVPAMLSAFLLTDRSFTKARMRKGTPS